MRLARRLALAGALALTGACRAAGTGGDTLTVFAATSLREPFEALARRFEAAHAGITVRLQFAGSQELRVQLEQGAAADVFAGADHRHAAALARAGIVEPPRVFARNEIVLAVPAGNPAGIAALADLPRARRVVVGAAEVPVGAYTRALLARAQEHGHPGIADAVLGRAVSHELSARQVLAKIALGEADAGFVYSTDAAAAGPKVAVVPLPPELRITATYPIAAVSGSRRPDLARTFVALVVSAEGQRRFAEAGFTGPAGGSP